MNSFASGELRREMLASRAAVGLARTMVRARLLAWGLGEVVPDALLVASELVANAVQACSWADRIALRLSRDSTGVLLEVWDPVHRPPTAQTVELTLETLDLDPAHFDDNHGWGLSIVQALSIECGWNPGPNGGKTVWSRLKPPDH
jgi:hypothetical protein